MTPNSLDQQLIKYLTDVHSIEQQALAQMKLAPGIAGDADISNAFSAHLKETETHEQLIAERLDAHGASPSKLKDIAGSLTGIGFGAFAKAQPDTPGKLVVHAFSYEHMEAAAYDLLGRVAERAGDAATVEVARRIGEQEKAMGNRLAAFFDRAADISVRGLNPEELQEQLNKYLADAHAIEAQALQLLDKGPQIAGARELAAAYEEHHTETEEHQRLVADRLTARGDSPSRLKDAALAMGALNWGAFFQAQPDMPAKLAGFAYAFEHLEIGAYEMLGHVATRAGDAETADVAARILAEERSAAEKIHSLFDEALDASLQAVGAA